MHHDPIADVLLVDRDPDVGESIISSLSRRRYEVEWVDDDEKAYNCLDTRPFDVLVTELNIERVDGMRLMGIAKDRNPDICVVMIAENPDIELATEAMRQGAYDFQTNWVPGFPDAGEYPRHAGGITTSNGELARTRGPSPSSHRSA